MPLPVAHGLLGASVAAALNQPFGARSWRALLLCAFLGICPDFDYALNWLRISGGGWHHGFTHSLLFALFLGLIAATVFGERKARSVFIFSSATFSHAVLDFLITDSRGVALCWPFTDQRYKLELPNPIDYTWRSGSVLEVAGDVLKISLTELIIFAPILIAVLFIRRLLVRRTA